MLVFEIALGVFLGVGTVALIAALVTHVNAEGRREVLSRFDQDERDRYHRTQALLEEERVPQTLFRPNRGSIADREWAETERREEHAYWLRQEQAFDDRWWTLLCRAALLHDRGAAWLLLTTDERRILATSGYHTLAAAAGAYARERVEREADGRLDAWRSRELNGFLDREYEYEKEQRARAALLTERGAAE